MAEHKVIWHDAKYRTVLVAEDNDDMLPGVRYLVQEKVKGLFPGEDYWETIAAFGESMHNSGDKALGVLTKALTEMGELVRKHHRRRHLIQDVFDDIDVLFDEVGEPKTADEWSTAFYSLRHNIEKCL